MFASNFLPLLLQVFRVSNVVAFSWNIEIGIQKQNFGSCYVCIKRQGFSELSCIPKLHVKKFYLLRIFKIKLPKVPMNNQTIRCDIALEHAVLSMNIKIWHCIFRPAFGTPIPYVSLQRDLHSSPEISSSEISSSEISSYKKIQKFRRQKIRHQKFRRID